jgi:hypothetical protein
MVLGFRVSGDEPVVEVADLQRRRKRVYIDQRSLIAVLSGHFRWRDEGLGFRAPASMSRV